MIADAHLLDNMNFLAKRHQQIHGRSIPCLSLTFSARGPPIDFVGAVRRLGPFERPSRGTAHTSGAKIGTRKLSAHVFASRGRCPSLTEFLTEQAFFDYSSGLEAIQFAVGADAENGVSPLTKAKPITFPASLKSLNVTVSAETFENVTMIHPEALSSWMGTCDPEGAVVVDAAMSNFCFWEQKEALRAHRATLSQLERARTGGTAKEPCLPEDDDPDEAGWRRANFKLWNPAAT